ncbi:FecR family protein [Mucilaginibacter gracilis]|uniref:FecR family protein n=1 Tax=Mucilaginibacter gracilis TaxID=423350 RepID=A0A495J8E2_9SPHI|nr:FecR domain-containing protein [Mucilaginibacter gracilis]RKR84299.1 FecR family protein [Mucilaginibacter gracilis]
MMKIERPSREALIRYYRGESLPHEEKLIDLYLAMDIDHDYVESCLREAWHDLEDDPDPFDEQQPHAEWQQFQQRRSGLSQVPPKRKLRWLGYAASFALLVLGGVAALIHSKNSTPGQAAYTHYTSALGKRREVKLADNSTVMLFPGSTLDVPANFNDRDRNVTVKGRAFFEVVHNSNKPFLVTTGRLVTKDIGTSFEVNEFAAANTNTVTLLTGKVSVAYAGKEIAGLIPDQQISYQTSTNKYSINRIDARQSMAWINGELSYDLAPLSVICRDMEKWYNVKITIKNPDLLNKKITTSFKDLTVNKVLDMLSVTSGLTYTINDNKITIN